MLKMLLLLHLLVTVTELLFIHSAGSTTTRRFYTFAHRYFPGDWVSRTECDLQEPPPARHTPNSSHSTDQSLYFYPHWTYGGGGHKPLWLLLLLPSSILLHVVCRGRDKMSFTVLCCRRYDILKHHRDGWMDGASADKFMKLCSRLIGAESSDHVE